MFSLAFKIQEFRWYIRHAGRNNYEFYLVTDVRLERTERHSLESLIHFTKKDCVVYASNKLYNR